MPTTLLDGETWDDAYKRRFEEEAKQISYFDLAVSLARQESESTMQRIASKSIALKTIRNRTDAVCCCSAYQFPHRPGSGQCPATNGEISKQDADQQELDDYTRAEARAINSGAW